MTFWLATPSTTFLLENLTDDHNCLIAPATVSTSTTSPSRTAPAGRATCPNRSRVAPFLPNDSSAARTPEVPMSRPTDVRPATGVSPAFRARKRGPGQVGRWAVSGREVGRVNVVLERKQDTDCAERPRREPRCG